MHREPASRLDGYSRPSVAEAAAGTLLAMACGDALGVPYEFAEPPADEAEMLGGGLGDYAPGEWSDDTQMAICIGQVAARGIELASTEGLDAVSLAFIAWLHQGATDVGLQTERVIREAEALRGSPSERLASSARSLHAATGRTAGNGALMRTAPVALAELNDRQRMAVAARRVAELTHADPLAGDSCVLWSEAIRAAVMDHRLDARAGLDLLPSARRDQWGAWIDVAEEADVSPALRQNGFTVTALQAAWHAIAATHDRAATAEANLRAGLQAAVHIGGDTDTVAAIAGSLLGAYWGAAAAPEQWREALHGWPGMVTTDLAALAHAIIAS